jgi:hypothetical protein
MMEVIVTPSQVIDNVTHTKKFNMKKTDRNQNMTNQRLRGDETVNTSSLPLDRKKNKPERFSDSNLNQPAGKTRQRYDDNTGTIENGIG